MWYRLTCSLDFSISHWTTHIGRPLLDKSVFLTPRLFHKTLWSSVCGCCTNTDPASLLFKRGFRYQSLWQRIFFDADTLFQPAFPYIQYRCEWIPDCNTLDPYLCLANMAELDTPSPPGKQRYPGLEGMRRYHSLSSEIWRKRRGGCSPKHMPRFTLDSPARWDHTLYRRGDPGIARTFAPGSRGDAMAVNQSRVCICESKYVPKTNNRPCSDTLTHSLLGTSDWQLL